jgi:hypothetical protein
MSGLGAGLAALAFWGFIAACVVSSVWEEVRRHQTRHETLRRIIESGKTVDQELMDELLERKKRPDRGLRTGGIVLLSIATGLIVIAGFARSLESPTFLPLLAIASLLACLGIGLLIAATYMRRSLLEDDTRAGGSPAVR